MKADDWFGIGVMTILIVGCVVLGFGLVGGLIYGLTWLTFLVWNELVVYLTGWPELTMWQAFFLLVALQIVSGILRPTVRVVQGSKS